MSFHSLLAAAPADGALSATIDDSWLQGRTAYGGLSAALAIEAARSIAPDLPPLRSAQVSFVGPLAGAVEARATLLRRGRNAAFVQSDVTSDAGLGLRATFVFMNALESHVDYDESRAPAATDPDSAVDAFKGPTHVSFVQNFDIRHARDKSDTRTPDFVRWVRVKERDGLDPMSEVMLVGDCLPPAAMALFDHQGPISSLTWMVNLLTPKPRTRNGWWLLRATANYARQGSSSQEMGIWNADGDPIASGMQSVAIFV